MYEAHCINASVMVCSNFTNTSNIFTSLICSICVCSRVLSQTVVCRCCSTVTTTSYWSWLTFWCDFLMAHLSVKVPSLCVQHVHNLWKHVESKQLHCPMLSVFKNIFQLSMKRCWCFYNLCLALLRENMGDEISSGLPATYFFPLVRTHPTHILLPIFLIYLLLFSLSNLMSTLWQAVKCINI